MTIASTFRRVLVTGATGTVGSTLVHWLGKSGARVRAIVRAPAQVDGAEEVVVADLEDVASLRAAVADCELVVHCAAELSDDPARCQRFNVDGVRHLLSAMQSERCLRLVHFSSVSVYDSRQRRDFDEDSPLWSEPRNAYGFSKAEGERLIRAAPIAATILRPVLVLSMHPRSYWGPLAIERARVTPGPSVPLATVPYVHVESLVQAVALAATRDVAIGRSYDVVDGNGDTREYLAAIYGALGRETPALPDGAPRVTYRGERIRHELGYAPVDRWRQFLDELGALPRSGNTRPPPLVSP